MMGGIPGDRLATVFGATGFIGRYVVQALAQAGWRVRVATRDPGRALFLRPYGVVGQVTPHFANIRDDATVAAAVDGADLVVNLVGILFEGGRQKMSAVHDEGAGRVARAAAAAGVGRLVHVSAIGADAGSPSVYARTKAAGEAAVRAAFPAATILRPSIVFGAEDAFFNRFAAMAGMSPALPLIGGGKTRFQPVYVGDVRDAVIAAAEREDVAGRVFELGGPGVYSFRELMALTLEFSGRRRALVTVPWGVARLQARVAGLLPNPPLTADQVTLLARDNVVGADAATLADLGIEASALEAIVPTYLARFRPGGRFHGRHRSPA